MLHIKQCSLISTYVYTVCTVTSYILYIIYLTKIAIIHPLDTSDDYFSKTTSSMEASAVAALEWACVADWRPKPDDTTDWMAWMYERVEQLTIIIMEQRIEWDRKGSEHPDVLCLNNERRKFFQDLLAGNIPTMREALEERDDEVIRLFDDIPSIANDTSTNSKKPRLFKNGIL